MLSSLLEHHQLEVLTGEDRARGDEGVAAHDEVLAEGVDVAEATLEGQSEYSEVPRRPGRRLSLTQNLDDLLERSRAGVSAEPVPEVSGGT